jgi:uncharacterized protein
MAGKYRIPYQLSAPKSGIKLTGGRLRNAFERNISFLKGFDLDRMLYWYRVHAGKPAPGAPYAFGDGHFENNLKGQTAGEFLMGACTALLWENDIQLRDRVRSLLAEMEACRDPDGFIIPVSREEFFTKEYPNYTRAWITFGLLDAGYSGEASAFRLAREMSDCFYGCNELRYVKDLNLGFQGILANTRMYDAPNGKWEDIQTAVDCYQEEWWLQQLVNKNHRAIYEHPGNHPHSSLLTALEGYCDLYRATGRQLYIDAVSSALQMYEDKWQHVGGGINMCENDTYYPGCNWLSPNHHYNELCSTNFWILLNQRMHLLYPDNAHYVDEIETSLYNVLLASQVGDQGFHYFNYLERMKDQRWQDRATCCAGLGTRLMGLLPQFLYSYTDTDVYCNIYAHSEACLPNGVRLRCATDMPDSGKVKIIVDECIKPFSLYLRMPRWAARDGKSYYAAHRNVQEGSIFELEFPFAFKATKYKGGEEIPHKERWALEYGPLLYAVTGAPTPVVTSWNPEKPEEWFVPADGEKRRLLLKNDNQHEYLAYLDIHDMPFSVYPIVENPPS